MKVVFAGSSVYGLQVPSGVVLRPPAAQGDLIRALIDGANVIGIIDGHFGWIASVWHKEILYALSLGVKVLGAASMGALRAADCAPFGMIPVGSIAAAYLAGELDDDADVALIQAPADFGFAPWSEALVDALATLERLKTAGIVTPEEHARLESSARNAFFVDRTPENIVAGATLGAERSHQIVVAYAEHRVSLKSRDALELLRAVADMPDGRDDPPDWEFPMTLFFASELRRAGFTFVSRPF